MAKKKELKGIRLGGKKLNWFNQQNNSSKAVRNAIEREIMLEEKNINFDEAINIYMKLKEEFKEDTLYHFKQAMKIYNQYLTQINNINIQVKSESSEIIKDVNNNNSSNKKIDDLNNKLDKL